jgi:hypothetical protein
MNTPAGYVKYRKLVASYKDEARNIDPETAEAWWYHGEYWDRHDIAHLSEEEEVGRLYFVRNPGSDIPVPCALLPKKKQKRIAARLASGELQAKQCVHQRIQEALRGEMLDDQLNGLKLAIIGVLAREPMPPGQRASRLRQMAEFLMQLTGSDLDDEVPF